MSIEERSIEVLPPEPTPTVGVTQRLLKRWLRLLASPLWLCLLLALIVRVWLAVHTRGVIDGDEALVGIQAEHILRGEWPIYFYGQPYLGSLEAYLIALLFAIFGPSAWTLRAEPILLSLVLTWLTWKLAGALADAAQLPPSAKRYFMTIAALLAAIPPLYDAIIEIRTFGGFIETFILMLLLLLSALQLTRRWQAGASRRELIWRWAGIGFIVGLGFWVYPLIVSAVLAAALWIIWQGWGISRGGNLLRGLLPAVAAIPTGLVGFAPAIFWGATHQWQNISYVLGLGGGTSIDRFSTIRRVTRLYVTCVAPRVVSGAVPKESAFLGTLHSLLLAVGMLCIFAIVALVALSILSPHAQLLRIRRLVALPLLFGACTAFIFCVSSVSASGLLSTCDADFAGRYATPLLLALPFFFATIFTVVSMYLHERSERQTQKMEEGPAQPQHSGAEASPIGTNVRARATARAHPAQPNHPCPYHTTERPAMPAYGRGHIVPQTASLRGRPGIGFVLQGILFALLLVYLGAQVWTYGLTDPATTFQSPFCLEAPANNEPIIAYMQHEHIHYAWAANLLAYPIVFKTDGNIVIANPLALTVPPLAIDRIPAYTIAVQHADRPSILVFAQHNDAHPALLMLLDHQQVTYRVARFPSQPGIDVLVVTPLNRTVAPFASQAFNSFFICSE